MDVISQKVNTFFMFLFIILLASHFALVTPSPTSTWVGSKYNIECTMCASCDNPCNQQPTPSSPPPPPSSPPPQPSPPLCPPPPSTTGGGGYYYSPPPPTTGSGGGGYYYSPPPPTQSVYLNYPPAPYKNYPTPGPPNPITSYYPYYYYNSPSKTMPSSTAGDSFSGATLLLLVLSTFCMFL